MAGDLPVARPFAAGPGFERYDGTIIQGSEDLGAPIASTPRSSGGNMDVSAIVDAMDAQTKVLVSILAELRAQRQEGAVYPVTLTTRGQVPVPITFNPPLFSISLTNNGPGKIQYRLPATGSTAWVDLEPSEVIAFNFSTGVIHSVSFRALGADGSIRAVGSY